MQVEVTLKATESEREVIRRFILDGTEHTPIYVWDNYDGTWAGEVAGIVFESTSAAELLEEIAAILREC